MAQEHLYMASSAGALLERMQSSTNSTRACVGKSFACTATLLDCAKIGPLGVCAFAAQQASAIEAIEIARAGIATPCRTRAPQRSARRPMLSRQSGAG